jgi:hypothetical protein
VCLVIRQAGQAGVLPDTEVALIPITDRQGPTREERLLSMSRGGGTAQVRIAGLQEWQDRDEQGRDQLGRSQVLNMPKMGETRHARDQLIREGDKGGQAGRWLLVRKVLCLPEEPPKPATLFLGL